VLGLLLVELQQRMLAIVGLGSAGIKNPKGWPTY
jgi:hypothetical protein